MRAGKTGVATALGLDVGDLEEYQPGHHYPTVWLIGDEFYCCAKKPPKPNDRWNWVPAKGAEWFTEAYGLTVYVHGES